MSHHDHVTSGFIAARDAPFTSCIMAAIRQAHPSQAATLRAVFPETYAEFWARHDMPGGLLDGEVPSGAAPPCHVVVISLDEEMVKIAREDGETVDPMDREFWQVDIRCEADRDDFTRDCVTWWQCDCTFTDGQWHALADEGDGPCPESPTGSHQTLFGTQRAARPSRHCWAQICDGSSDAIYELADAHNLGPGEYQVHVHPSGDEYVEFELAGSAS